jgi:hypothetical protein
MFFELLMFNFFNKFINNFIKNKNNKNNIAINHLNPKILFTTLKDSLII